MCEFYGFWLIVFFRQQELERFNDWYILFFQIEYVFIDKIGIFIENDMQFRECFINGY